MICVLDINIIRILESMYYDRDAIVLLNKCRIFSKDESFQEFVLLDIPCIPTIAEGFLPPENTLFWPSYIEPFPKAAKADCQREMDSLLQRMNL
jgi:hypothetical protein